MVRDKTRIAIFLGYLGGGGAERVILNLAAGFVARGLKVDLVLAKAWGPHLWKIPSEVRLVDLNASRIALSLPKLIRYLQTERPEALISAMHYANEIAILARKLAGVSTQVIVTEHNTLSCSLVQMKGFKRKLVPLGIRFLYPLADRVVTVSKGARDDIIQWVGHSRFHVDAIYNPVITSDLYAKAAAPVEHPWFQQGEPPVILGVGKLEAQKNFTDLIRAFKEVHSQTTCRLAILGWGPDRENLQALIDELGLSEDIALLGYVDNPYAYMARSQAFVLSSAWEGLPTVLIEAMALGLPVVSTNCKSGPEEILNCGEYGYLVPLKDISAMADAIQAVMDGQFPIVDQAWLKQFGIHNSVSEYLRLIDCPGLYLQKNYIAEEAG